MKFVAANTVGERLCPVCVRVYRLEELLLALRQQLVVPVVSVSQSESVVF